MWSPGSTTAIKTHRIHIRSEWPILGEQVQQGERHGEGAQEQVRHGQVGNENIPCSQHDLHHGSNSYQGNM